MKKRKAATVYYTPYCGNRIAPREAMIPKCCRAYARARLLAVAREIENEAFFCENLAAKETSPDWAPREWRLRWHARELRRQAKIVRGMTR